MRGLLSLCFLLSFSYLHSQIVTDRPNQTKSPITVPVSSVQIETGVQISYTSSGDLSTREWLFPTTLLRLGVAKGFELRVVSQYQSTSNALRDNNGIADLEIGAKVWLAGGGDAKTNVGLITHFRVPSGHRDLASDDVGVNSFISIDHMLSHNLSLAYNLGFNSTRSTDGAFTYTMALGWDITDRVKFYVEPYGAYSGALGFEANANAGLAYLISDNVQADFSFGTGLTDRMNYLSTGISWLIK